MISGFKLWLENEALDTFINSNNKAKSIHKWLLRKPEIVELLKEVDDQNILVSREPGETGVLYTNGFRIPIQIQKSTDPKYIGLKRIDGKDFSEINDLWPFYPNKNDRTVIEVNKTTRIINNDNAGNFCKIIAKLLSSSDQSIEKTFDNFWKENQGKLEYIANNPRLLSKIINDGKFDEDMFKIDSLNMRGRQQFDPTEDDEREDFNVVISFPDGLHWVEHNEKGDYPRIVLTLADDNYKSYAELFMNTDRRITSNTYSNAFENNIKLFLPHLKAILISDRIHGCDDNYVFPGPYFGPKEKFEIIQANPKLKDNDKLEIMLGQLQHGGPKKDQIISYMIDRVPKLKELKIVEVDRTNFVILTNLVKEKDFDWGKIIKSKVESAGLSTLIDDYIIYATEDIVDNIVDFVKKIQDYHKDNFVFSKAEIEELISTATNEDSAIFDDTDMNLSKRSNAIVQLTKIILREIGSLESGPSFVKNIAKKVSEKEIINSINKSFSVYYNELTRFLIQKTDPMTAKLTLAISPFLLDEKAYSLAPEISDKYLEDAINNGFETILNSVSPQSMQDHNSKKELKTFFKLFREMLAYFWDQIGTNPVR